MRANTFLTIGLIILVGCQSNENSLTMNTNPFYTEFDTPYGVPDFEKIKAAHFLPAIKKGIQEQKDEMEKIKQLEADPDFNNTILAMERSGNLLTRVTRVFYNLLSANTSDSLQAIAREASPILSMHEDEILMDSALFARVKSVYDQKASLNLGVEEQQLLTEYYKNFIRSGANLNKTHQAELREINERLSLLYLQFGDNLLAWDNSWMLVVDNESDLKGLPGIIKASAANDAKEKGLEGKWVVTLHKPSWIPFLQYAENRSLREEVYKAWMNRGNNDDQFDNKSVLSEIISLRHQKAQLLGYNTWADYMLDNNMAKTRESAVSLLNDLWEKALPMAKTEVEEMQAMIAEEGGKFDLAPWDWWYYAEKVRKRKYDLDDETLRPYFPLTQVQKGLFNVVNQLYGLQMEAIPHIPKPHPDTEAFEVKEKDGTLVGILYMDFHPRGSKGGGAWMDAYRKQSKMDGRDVLPVITTVFNFTKSSGDKPALLTFDEVSTMYHEMGHALHGLLSDCTYPTISGTATPQDFVELPSQIMENWAAEPTVMKQYARHYESGEAIPDELVDKIIVSSKFNQGFITTEYLAASLLDMSWHTEGALTDLEPIEFEKSAMESVGLIKEILPRYRSTYFAHIFTGDDYSAGYYSYIWAAVLDADAYQAFVETGDIFNPEIARSFRKNILEKGGADEAMQLYRNFRGKDPSVEPLLKRRGLL